MRKIFTKKLQKTFYWASTFTEMVTFISEYWGNFHYSVRTCKQGGGIDFNIGNSTSFRRG